MNKRITLKIDGMECPNCAMKLEGIEDKLQGVHKAKASYHKSQLIIEYDELLLTLDQVKGEVKRMGYEVTSIKPL